MAVLDCRGLPCPEPVVRCRDWLAGPHPEGDDVLEVLVDNSAAVQNVSNFLTGRGWCVNPRLEGPGMWRLVAARAGDRREDGNAGSVASPASESLCNGGGGRTLVFLSSETIGRGDDGLGARLMVNFLGSLPELGSDLWRIVLVNGGVKLAAGGPALEKLRALADAGVSILVCGTCLEHYGLLEHRQVGDTTNMLDIVTSLQLADKVIRP